MTDPGLKIIAELETILLEMEEQDAIRRLARLNDSAWTVKQEIRKLEVRMGTLAMGIISLGDSLIAFLPEAVRPLAQAIVNTVMASMHAFDAVAAASTASGPIGWIQAGMAAAAAVVAGIGLAMAIDNQGRIDQEMTQFSSQMSQMSNALTQILNSFRWG